jgi:hypothetical protein
MSDAKVKTKEREYKLPNGSILKMSEEEFQRLVEYFLALQKIELSARPE